MSLDDWLGFLVASLIVLVIPGPTVLMVTRYSIAYGRHVNPYLVGAVALGDCAAICVSLLAGRLATVCVTVLVRSRTMRRRAVPRVYRRVTIPEVVCCLSDAGARPYSMADFLEHCRRHGSQSERPRLLRRVPAQFVDADGGATRQLPVLAGTCVALSTSNATPYATLASSIRRMLDSASGQHRFHMIAGSLLVCTAIWALSAGG